MRLREISKLIKKIDIKDLDLPQESGGPDTTRLKNLDAYRKAILILSKIPAFDSYTSGILNSAIFQTSADKFAILDSDYYRTNHLSELLQIGAKALQESIDAQLGEEDICSISVKLPDSRELRAVVDDLNTIEKVLSQVVVNSIIDGKTEVNTWEPGSLWIEIFLGSAAATSLIGSIIWASMVIYKKRQEGKIFAEYAKGLSIKNESLSSLLDAQKSAIDLQIESEAIALNEEYFSQEKTDPERIQRLQYAIKEFSKLIARGAEVHPALSAPEEVKNLFPNSINPLSIELRIPRIEDSKS